MSLAARPRLDAECLDLVDLLAARTGWTVPVASTLHPSRIASSIRSTSKLTGSLEAIAADLSIVGGAEDDVTGQRLEVDRKGHRPPSRAKDHSPDTSPGQQFSAFLLIDGDQVRIGRRAGPSVGPALFSTEEIRGRHLECKRNPQ